MVTQFRSRLGQVDRNEDGESYKEVLIEHLIICQILIVVVEDSYCRELCHCKQNHHAKTMEVGTEASSADPQAIDYCF